MGAPTAERNAMREMFSAAFSNMLDQATKDSISIVILDFMKYVKFLDEQYRTLGDCIRFFVERVSYLMLFKFPKARVFIVLVDGEPVPVKRMVEHVGRYKDKNVFSAKKGPYLPKSMGDLVPQPWIQFAGNYKLLRRELYPLLYNAFIFCTHFQPKPGQMLVLSGFPGPSAAAEGGGGGGILQPWHPYQLPLTRELERGDPDLYHRVYFVEHKLDGSVVRGEWIEAKNDISEADTRMFYFDHWFQKENICFVLNDGDILSIGLLYAFERASVLPPAGGGGQNGGGEGAAQKFPSAASGGGGGEGGGPESPENSAASGGRVFRNTHIALLDDKRTEFSTDTGEKKKKENFDEYVNFNTLYNLVNAHPRFAGAQCPEACMVFLMISGGCDFFKSTMAYKGIGAQTIVWPVFFENISLFSHMIQKAHGVERSTRTRRKIVIDEDAFRKFILFCYMEKYSSAAVAGGTPATAHHLRTAIMATKNAQKDKAYNLPDRNTIRLWCRQIEYIFDYWSNAVFGFHVDPFEEWFGLPYYPYVQDKETGEFKMVSVVAHKPKPVDEIYARHMLAFRMAQQKDKKEAALKRQRVKEALGE